MAQLSFDSDYVWLPVELNLKGDGNQLVKVTLEARLKRVGKTRFLEIFEGSKAWMKHQYDLVKGDATAADAPEEVTDATVLAEMLDGVRDIKGFDRAPDWENEHDRARFLEWAGVSAGISRVWYDFHQSNLLQQAVERKNSSKRRKAGR